MKPDEPPAKPKRRRNPPLDRRKLPVMRAMLEVAQNHKISGDLLLAYQIAWKHHQYWNFGDPWDSQVRFLYYMDQWFKDAMTKIQPGQWKPVQELQFMQGEVLAVLMDETIKLRQHYEMQSTQLH